MLNEHLVAFALIDYERLLDHLLEEKIITEDEFKNLKTTAVQNVADKCGFVTA